MPYDIEKNREDVKAEIEKENEARRERHPEIKEIEEEQEKPDWRGV